MNLELHFWGFQGQTVDYSDKIWGSSVLSQSSFVGRLPHDQRKYKDVINKGLCWRFDSSDTEFAVTRFQMIPLKDRVEDFFAGTVVVPRGKMVTEAQLGELQTQVEKAIEVLGRIITKMRPDEMGPLQGELNGVKDNESLDRPHEICIFAKPSGYTLAGLLRQLAELHHRNLTVFIVDTFNGQSGNDEDLQAIRNIAQQTHPQANLLTVQTFDELQREDNRLYQELLDDRAEQKRKKEEEERQRLAKQEEERKTEQKRKDERDARRARFLATFKKAAKGLGILTMVAGLGYGGYVIKDDILGVFTPQKVIKQPRALLSADIDLTTHPDSTLSKELEWSHNSVYLRQTFKFDSLYTSEKLVAENRADFPPDVSLYIHHSDSLVHGLVVEIDAMSEFLGKIDTLSLSPSDLPGLPLSSLIVILKKSEVEKDEQLPLDGNEEVLSMSIEVDSSLTDSSNAAKDSL